MTDDTTTAADSTSSQGDDEVAALRAELEAAQAELARWKDSAARAQADLQNAKARMEREAADLRLYASEQTIRKILPTLDNFQRAFLHIPETLQQEEWVKGVTAIEQDLFKHLAEAGLKRMKTLGAVADPARHEIITMGPGAEGTVTEVLEEGYELHDRVLRPAKVRVGDGTGAPKAPGAPA